MDRHSGVKPPGCQVAADCLATTTAAANSLACLTDPTQRLAARALMRINIWIVLAFLLVLFAVTRYLRYQEDTQRICADDPTASVCER